MHRNRDKWRDEKGALLASVWGCTTEAWWAAAVSSAQEATRNKSMHTADARNAAAGRLVPLLGGWPTPSALRSEESSCRSGHRVRRARLEDLRPCRVRYNVVGDLERQEMGTSMSCRYPSTTEEKDGVARRPLEKTPLAASPTCQPSALLPRQRACAVRKSIGREGSERRTTRRSS